MQFYTSLIGSIALFASVSLSAEVTQAYADLHPTAGNKVEGRVVFQKVDQGVKVVAHISGLTPGLHGFHIHEKGDCSAPDGSSAGGHFNPDNKPHGSPESATRHVGDLGNIVANEKGEAVLERVDSLLQLEGPSSIIGRAVVVHADPDDFTTQPTGNAGKRLSCGVIQNMKKD